MKILFLILLISLSWNRVYSQKSLVNYQAIIRDVNGNPRSEENINIIVIIEFLEENGEFQPQYSESHDIQTSIAGLINLEIGSQDPQAFNQIPWDLNSYWITLEIDGEIEGKSKIHSVPYALYAERAGNVFSGDYNDLTNKPQLITDVSGLTDSLNLLLNPSYNTGLSEKVPLSSFCLYMEGDIAYEECPIKCRQISIDDSSYYRFASYTEAVNLNSYYSNSEITNNINVFPSDSLLIENPDVKLFCDSRIILPTPIDRDAGISPYILYFLTTDYYRENFLTQRIGWLIRNGGGCICIKE